MKMKRLIIFVPLLLLVVSTVAHASQVILDSIKDAGILQSAPTANYGSADHAWIGYDQGYANSLIMFDLSPYQGMVVESAFLEL
jgi:hypothetical protein